MSGHGRNPSASLFGGSHPPGRPPSSLVNRARHKPPNDRARDPSRCLFFSRMCPSKSKQPCPIIESQHHDNHKDDESRIYPCNKCRSSGNLLLHSTSFFPLSFSCSSTAQRVFPQPLHPNGVGWNAVDGTRKKDSSAVTGEERG